MTTKLRNPTTILLLAVLLAYWGTLIWQLGAQWSLYEQYNYGWFVPLLCLYLLWRRMHSREPASETAGPPMSAGGHAPSFKYWPVLILCALLYAPTRLFHEANPTWRLTSLLWTLEVIATTLILLRALFLISDLRPLTSGLSFPICFFLVAVPWPSGLEGLLTQSLMHWNAGTTVECLGLCGIPAAQHGNVIEISAGVIGIDEACSGIRSLQATLMISLFFGEFYRLTFWRRIFCVLAGVALAYVFNIGRTLLLVSVASRKGIAEMARWHDPAGVTILVGCFLGLWLISILLSRRPCRAVAPSEGGSAAPAPCSTLPAAVPTSDLRPLTSGLCLLLGWFIIVEAGTHFWYATHERAVASNANWAIHLPSAPGYRTETISKNIASQFHFDDGFEGKWQDETGAIWQVYYFRWLPTHSLNKRVAVHLAKTHGPEKCLPRSGMTLKADLGTVLLSPSPKPSSSASLVPAPGSPLPASFRLAVHQYVFEVEGRTLHVFYGIYEDSTGGEVLANRRLNAAGRIRAALSGSCNYGQRFLEIAVTGYAQPEDARRALEEQLSNILVF